MVFRVVALWADTWVRRYIIGGRGAIGVRNAIGVCALWADTWGRPYIMGVCA